LKLTYNKLSNYSILDTETTGLDSRYDDVIEIGILRVRENEIVDKFHTYVKPQFEISDFITQLTGITNEMVKNAPSFNEALPLALNFIGQDVIVGQNVNFDIRFLTAERYGGVLLTELYSDTMYIGRKVLPHLNHHRLSDLANALEIQFDTMHNVVDDCMATYNVYNKLHELAKTRNIDLNANFKSKNKDKYINFKTLEINDDTMLKIDSPFYEKHVCFTGTLERYPRLEVAQIIVNIGGFVDNTVTKQTNFLVIGDYNYYTERTGKKSSKRIRAENNKLNGEDIEIISEKVFYQMLELNEEG